MDHVSAGLTTGAWPGQPADSEPLDSSDEVFKALADPSRRLLLDSLFVDDGQSLGQLSAHLPGMTRFGVMKHLRLLEAAGLVTAHKIGREKLHYLNPVPIRLIHDRWTSKYAAPWVGALADLKVSLEASASQRPRLVFQVSIRSRPGPLWQVISDPEVAERTLAGARVEVGEADPPRRLVATWTIDRPAELSADPPARVTWEIEPVGEDMCRLTVRHDEFPNETAMFQWLNAGWPVVLSNLRRLLETDAPLTISH